MAIAAALVILVAPVTATAQAPEGDSRTDPFTGEPFHRGEKNGTRPGRPPMSVPPTKTPPGKSTRPRLSEPREKLDLSPDGQLNSAPDVTVRNKAPSGKDADAERRRRQLRSLLRRRPRQHVPQNAGERDQLLQTLYGHLAGAKDKTASDRIKAAIERVWATSGSDTVALLMRRALKAGKHKNYDKALRFLNHIVKIAPSYAEGWNQRAYVYFKKKDLHRALGDLRRVLALDPYHYKALLGLGRTLQEIDEARAALDVYRQLLKVYPLSPSAKRAIQHLSAKIGGQEI